MTHYSWKNMSLNITKYSMSILLNCTYIVGRIRSEYRSVLIAIQLLWPVVMTVEKFEKWCLTPLCVPVIDCGALQGITTVNIMFCFMQWIEGAQNVRLWLWWVYPATNFHNEALNRSCENLLCHIIYILKTMFYFWV